MSDRMEQVKQECLDLVALAEDSYVEDLLILMTEPETTVEIMADIFGLLIDRCELCGYSTFKYDFIESFLWEEDHD